VDGTGQPERLTKPEAGAAHVPASFSPRGDALLFAVTKNAATTLWTLSIRDHKAALFDRTESIAAPAATFSPDGRWVIYPSDRAGGIDGLFVQPYPPTGRKYQITKNRGRYPVWSRDGNELFYFVSNQLETVSVTTTPTFAVGNGVLFPAGASMSASTPARRDYDIAPDGKRFVSLIQAGQNDSGATAPRIHIVLSWFEELKARVPTK
jgi:hypothetical protein